MKILFSPFSPYVRKCLVTGLILGLNDRITLQPAQAHPIQRDRSIIVSNPLGKVPTFFTDDGQVLYDSRVICEYLNDLAQGELFPAPGPARWAALTRQSLGDGMLDAALLARYEDAARPEPLRWADWKNAQLDKIETSLAALNATVLSAPDAAPSSSPGSTDIGSITIGCALWYLDLRFSDLGWRDRYPQVSAWYASYSQRPAMQASWSL